MSVIRMFRFNGYDDVTDGIEFYFKAEREADSLLICNFCVSDEGIFYYRKGSKILSPNETASARNTPHGFISMEDLTNVFEMLRKARLHRYEEGKEKKLKVTARGRKVVIERAED